MRFLVLLSEEDPDLGLGRTPRRRSAQAVLDGHAAFDRAVRDRGGRWSPARRSRTRRGHGARRPRGGRVVTEGPFAESVEHLGGFYVAGPADGLDDARRPVPAADLGLRGRGPARRSRSRRLRLRGTGPDRRRRPDRGLARRVGPPAGPARRAVPPPRPRRGRSRRRLRGGRPDLAARRRTAQPAGLAADRRPAPDPRPAARRGGGGPEAAAARRRVRPAGGGATRHGRCRRGGARRAAAAGAAVRAPGAGSRVGRRADPAAGARRLDRRTSPGCSWSAPRPWPPG